MNSRKHKILIALIFLLPVIIVVLHHYVSHVPGLKPTGFLINENVLYMSYAHQYLDQDNFSLFYSNPFDGDPASPKIYFQPATWVFALLLKTGIDPGLCLTLFGICMAFACIYIGVVIIKHLLPESRYQAGIAGLFTWGGGLTAITGLIAQQFVTGYSATEWIDGIYLADPAQGWWGLNWGRTLFLPMEAFYHFLFLLNIYYVLKEKWRSALIFALLLSASHPFTGIEYLLIMISWLVIEKIISRKAGAPYWFLIGLIITAALHSWYYLGYLNGFPEHQVIFNQYSRAWTYSLRVAIPAYFLVFILAVISLVKFKPVRAYLSKPSNRLFLCWIIVAFLLSKHEWFIRPMQPIHFTRGYVWAGLFLFALPGIAWLLDQAFKNRTRKLILAISVLVFLSDNILWTANQLRGKAHDEWEGHITNESSELLDFLEMKSNPNDLVIGNAPIVSYLANAYTAANTWTSHPFNTPGIENRSAIEKQFMQTGIEPGIWKGRRLLLILDKKVHVDIHGSIQKNKLFENDRYMVLSP